MSVYRQHLEFALTSRFLLLLAVFLFLSCTTTQPRVPESASSTPQRVVAFGPSIVEFLYEMELQNRIVGVSAFSDYPPEAASLPAMGHVNEPDYEKMLRVQPQLVLGLGEAVKVREMAERLNTPCETLRLESLADIVAAPTRLGKLMGEEEKGVALTEKLERELEDIRRETAQHAEKPRVLAVIGRADKEVFTSGKGSFVTEMVHLAGGISVTAEEPKRWLNLDWERVLAYQPDAIVVFHAYDNVSEEEQIEMADFWKRYQSLPAVRNQRVHVLTGSHLLKSGPRIFQGIRDLAAVLHTRQ
ncbi:MAG: ABC transporter substrate-binding protein [Acidobacteriota bacterium]|nr:ABC transporter substrate-binding protein [Acidobacteriota bacterium]